MTSTLTARAAGEQIPMLFLHPKEDWNGQVVIWADAAGKAGLLADDGAPAAGGDAAGGRLLGGGGRSVHAGRVPEGPEQAARRARTQPYGDGKQPWQQAAGLHVGYNPPLFARACTTC